MKRSLIVLLIGCLFLLSGSLFAQQLTEIQIPSARSAAMGGIHTALSDDLNTIFSNPAGFHVVESELSISELTVGLSGPIFDIAGVVIEAAGGVAVTIRSLKNPRAGMKFRVSVSDRTKPMIRSMTWLSKCNIRPAEDISSMVVCFRDVALRTEAG